MDLKEMETMRTNECLNERERKERERERVAVVGSRSEKRIVSRYCHV